MRKPANPSNNLTPLISKDNFPIFKNNPGLVYLDSAATAQLHKKTINAISGYYRKYNSNPPRGLYDISVEAEEEVKDTRDIVRDFLGLDYADEIVFTKNTTESLNLLAKSLAHTLTSDDEIIIFSTEHHSNLLPWLEVARATGAKPIVLECDFSEPMDYESFHAFLTPNVRIVAISGMSNVTGHQPDLGRIADTIRNSFASRALIVIDAAQLVAHNPERLYDVDFDAVAFSGHKLGAPSGIGVLALRAGLSPHLSPVNVGGGTVDFMHMRDTGDGVARTEIKYRSDVARLEPGTQNIGGIIGLGSALEMATYSNKYSMDHREEYERNLFKYLLKKTKNIPGLTIHFAENGIFTFNIDGVHPHDAAQLLAEDDICVRAGYHCAQPLHEIFDLGPTVRASLSWYNDTEDIDKFASSLKTIRRRMGL